jgi:hypothetical protein
MMLIDVGFSLTLGLAVGGWIASLLGAIYSVMSFDAPKAQARWQAWAFLVGICTLCLATLGAIIASRSLFQDGRTVPAFILLTLPAAAGSIFLFKRLRR